MGDLDQYRVAGWDATTVDFWRGLSSEQREMLYGWFREA